MNNKLDKKSIIKNYAQMIIMIVAMVAGCFVGFLFPVTEASAGATVLKPLGTVFINMMFCIVVPLVFASISGAVANAGNRKHDVIFVNGDSNLENLRGSHENWSVKMTELEFKKRMFEET